MFRAKVACIHDNALVPYRRQAADAGTLAGIGVGGSWNASELAERIVFERIGWRRFLRSRLDLAESTVLQRAAALQELECAILAVLNPVVPGVAALASTMRVLPAAATAVLVFPFSWFRHAFVLRRTIKLRERVRQLDSLSAEIRMRLDSDFEDYRQRALALSTARRPLG